MSQLSQLLSDYSNKAQVYTHFRWPYAAEAGESLARHTALNGDSVVADIGCGTGMVLALLADRAGTIWGIEPDAEMRAVASQTYGHLPGIELRNGTAEATSLAAQSVDLITVGRALHWFSALQAGAEFRRILRPGGWLAALSVRCMDEKLRAAERELRISAHGFNATRSKARRPAIEIGDYLAHSQWTEIRCVGMIEEHFEDFFGRQQTFSDSPGPDHPLFPVFEQAAQDIFHFFAPTGLLSIPVCTLIQLGQMDHSHKGT